jgi:hypothetical protein
VRRYVIAVGTALVLIASGPACGGDSRAEAECRKEMSARGWSGDELDQVVDTCVDIVEGEE